MSQRLQLNSSAAEVMNLQRVTLGRISGLFGVHGWVKVFSDTSPPSNILNYPNWHLCQAGVWSTRRLRDGRTQGKGIVVLLEGCDDRDQAAELVGAEVAVPRAELPIAASNEYYWTDLVGASVITLQGTELGQVQQLFSTGSNDVMVVRGERERLLPFIADTVVEVDLAHSRITVDWDPEF